MVLVESWQFGWKRVGGLASVTGWKTRFDNLFGDIGGLLVGICESFFWMAIC